MRLLLPAALLVVTSSAWIPPQRGVVLRKYKTSLFSESPDTKTSSESNPCWQDIFDADCTMDSIFSARFVASEWIKELPCGSGLEASHFHCSCYPFRWVIPETNSISFYQRSQLSWNYHIFNANCKSFFSFLSNSSSPGLRLPRRYLVARYETRIAHRH